MMAIQSGSWARRLILLLLALLVLSPTACADWWNNSFTRRVQINITNPHPTGLTNFPTYINVTYDGDMQSDFDDIRFVNGTCDNAGVQMAYEIERNYTGSAAVWVNIPNLPAGNSSICMYYGNLFLNSGEDAAGVWDNDYLLVMHLSETSGTYYDSTKYGNNGTLVDANSNSVRGAAAGVDGGIDLNGDADYITIPDRSALDLTGDISMEVWAYPHTFTNEPDLLAKGTYSSAYALWFNAAALLRFGINNDRLSTSALSANNWYYIAATRGGSDRRLYMNGRLNVSDTYGTAINTNNNALTVGSSSYPFNGVVDEIRLSNISRSAAWVNETYLLVTQQSTIVKTGGEESLLSIYRSLPDPIDQEYYAVSNMVLWNPSATAVTLDFVEERWYNNSAIDVATCAAQIPSSGLTCSCSSQNCTATWSGTYTIPPLNFTIFKYRFNNDKLSRNDVLAQAIVNTTAGVIQRDNVTLDYIQSMPAVNPYLSKDNTTFLPAVDKMSKNYNATVYVQMTEEGGHDRLKAPAVLQIILDDRWASVGSSGNTVYQTGGIWYINHTRSTDLPSGSSDYTNFYGITPDLKGKLEVNASIYNAETNGANIHELLLRLVNAPPTVASATVTPDPAYSCYNLTCVNGSASDADGDTVTFKYRWLQDGVVIAGQTSMNLSGAYFNATDSMQCEITPYDGIDDGAPVTSPSLVITQSDLSGPCNESCSHDVDCVSDDCCVGVCQQTALTCCGEDGCETPTEGLGNCPSDCCDYDCTATYDDTCHVECTDDCVGVNETCDDKTINSCGNSTGDCLGCQYYDCPYTLCVDSCFGTQWRSGDDVPNACDVGGTEQCSGNQCSWDYTCDYDYAGECENWLCDEDADCQPGYVCTGYCACVKGLFRVWTSLRLSMGGELSRSENLWMAEG